jgi:hypothetical protein
MKKIIVAVVILVTGLLLAPAAFAQTTTCNQGMSSANYEWGSNVSAKKAGKTTEVLVLNATTTKMPTTAFANRKAIELQNNGPNTIYCTVDGSDPAVDGGQGRQISSGGTWAIDAGPLIIVNCRAGTADQATHAATMVTELR